MLYAPVKETAGQRILSYATLWKEGMSTVDPENRIIISEEIRLAPYIKKEAEMGKSFLSFLSSFNGTMDIKAIREPNPRSKRNLLEQRFVGSYQMSTAISFYSAPKYLYPHVTIEKKAAMVDENTALFQINVTNDGNELLRRLNVTDRMPLGLGFINSSLRPEVNGQFINWTISTLEISRTLTIKLHARVKGDHQIYTNIVGVTAAAKDMRIEAKNSTRFEAYYSPLPCCPGQELLRMGNVTPIRPYWGAWKPSPCFNVTTGDIDGAKEIEKYYDELERNFTSCCASNYEIP
jgi:uncharacterized repeat protein (TIGR01451 family)